MNLEPVTKQEQVFKLLQETPGMKYKTGEIADCLGFPQDCVTTFVLVLFRRRRIRSDRIKGVRPYGASYWVG
jgi:hypothetical protein